MQTAAVDKETRRGSHLGGKVQLVSGDGRAHGHGDGGGGGYMSLSVPGLHAVRRQDQEVRGGHGVDVLAGEHARLPVDGPESPA